MKAVAISIAVATLVAIVLIPVGIAVLRGIEIVRSLLNFTA